MICLGLVPNESGLHLTDYFFCSASTPKPSFRFRVDHFELHAIDMTSLAPFTRDILSYVNNLSYLFLP